MSPSAALLFVALPLLCDIGSHFTSVSPFFPHRFRLFIFFIIWITSGSSLLFFCVCVRVCTVLSSAILCIARLESVLSLIYSTLFPFFLFC